jgi:hypothetical protein
MNYSLGNMLSRGRRVAFNPLSLSPALWLSDTGSNPAQWDDLSGNGRHATQAIGANQPAIVTGALNGRQVRRFDGVDDTMTFSSLNIVRNISALTIIAVYKWLTNPTSSKAVFAAQGNGTTGLRAWCGGGLSPQKLNVRARRIESDAVEIVNSAADNTTNFMIHAGIINYTGQQLSQFINGALDGSISASFASGNSADTNSNAIALGSNPGTGNFADIEFAELLIFQSALSTENRRRIEGYLSVKYNIALS